MDGGAVADVHLRDLSLHGGRRALRIEGGAGQDGPIVASRLDILASVRAGVVIDGLTTLTVLEDLLIDGVIAEHGALGRGLVIQTRAPLTPVLTAPHLLIGITIHDTVEVGLLVDGGWIDAQEVLVTTVAPLGGGLGRGVQLQNFSAGSVAFSCKGRAFCPSCGVRRMVESAARWVDRLFPVVPFSRVGRAVVARPLRSSPRPRPGLRPTLDPNGSSPFPSNSVHDWPGTVTCSPRSSGSSRRRSPDNSGCSLQRVVTSSSPTAPRASSSCPDRL